MSLSLVKINQPPTEAQRRAYAELPPIPRQGKSSAYTEALWRVAVRFPCSDCLVPAGRRCINLIHKFIEEGTPHEIQNPHASRKDLAWKADPSLIRSGKLPNEAAQRRERRQPAAPPEPPESEAHVLRSRLDRIWDIAMETGCPFCHMPPGQRCMELSYLTGFYYPIALPHADRVL